MLGKRDALVALAGLIDGRELSVQSRDFTHALHQSGLAKGGGHVGDVVALPEGVPGVVAPGVEREDLLQDPEVVRDVEAVAAVLVAEEVVEVVVPAPRDGRQAQRAGLMRGQEDAVLGIRQRLAGALVQFLDGVHLAVPERILHFVVALGDHQGEVGLPQDRCAEELVAAFDFVACLGCDVALDHV